MSWAERGEGEGSGIERPRESGLELDDPAEIDDRGDEHVSNPDEKELE